MKINNDNMRRSSTNCEVSVIIPVYNAEKYIGQTLESVLRQTFQDYEIIIINDGSTDDSYSIAKTYQQRNENIIKIFGHKGESNRGVAVSRNLGIKKSHGRFIAFLDADDQWFPHKLRRQVDVMKSDPSLGMCYTKADIIRDIFNPKSFPGLNSLGDPLPEKKIEVVKSLMTGKIKLAFSSVMVRASVVKKIRGFSEKLAFQSEDREMLVRLCAEYNGAFIQEVLCQYRFHEENYTSKVINEEIFYAVILNMQVNNFKWLRKKEY